MLYSICDVFASSIDTMGNQYHLGQAKKQWEMQVLVATSTQPKQ